MEKSSANRRGHQEIACALQSLTALLSSVEKAGKDPILPLRLIEAAWPTLLRMADSSFASDSSVVASALCGLLRSALFAGRLPCIRVQLGRVSHDNALPALSADMPQRDLQEKALLRSRGSFL